MQIGISFKKYFVDIVSFLLIFLFVYAAVSKIADYQKFQVQLGQSPMLTHFSGTVAWVIPTVELLIAVSLSIPAYRLAGLYASFALMVMFSVYIIAITKYSEYIPCSCGGVLQHMTWDQHLVFNFLFVLFSLFGVLLYQPNKSKNIFVATESGEYRKPV